MAQTSQNGPNIPKWSKIPKVAQMAQTTQNGLNDPKWSKRPQGPNGPNGPECSKVIQAAQDGPKWPNMTQRGQNIPKWSRVDQSGPLWQIPTQESPIWINTNPGRQFIIAHIRREDGDVLSSRWLRAITPPLPLTSTSATTNSTTTTTDGPSQIGWGACHLKARVTARQRYKNKKIWKMAIE